jgi:hypothetical protein
VALVVRQRAQFDDLSAQERAQEPGTAQLLPVDAFDFFRTKLREGERYYLAVTPGRLHEGVDRAQAGRVFGASTSCRGPGRFAAEGSGRPHRRHRPPLARRPARPGREVLGRQLLRRSGAAVTGSLAGLLVANALYLVVGAALLPLLRIAHTRRQLVSRSGSRTCSASRAGMLASYLALIGVPVGSSSSPRLAVLLGILGWLRARRLPSLRRTGPGARRAPVASLLLGVAALVARSCCSAHAARPSRCGRSSSGTGGRSGR